MGEKINEFQRQKKIASTDSLHQGGELCLQGIHQNKLRGFLSLLVQTPSDFSK